VDTTRVGPDFSDEIADEVGNLLITKERGHFSGFVAADQQALRTLNPEVVPPGVNGAADGFLEGGHKF
jgi:hypothetical protein